MEASAFVDVARALLGGRLGAASTGVSALSLAVSEVSAGRRKMPAASGEKSSAALGNVLGKVLGNVPPAKVKRGLPVSGAPASCGPAVRKLASRSIPARDTRRRA